MPQDPKPGHMHPAEQVTTVSLHSHSIRLLGAGGWVCATIGKCFYFRTQPTLQNRNSSKEPISRHFTCKRPRGNTFCPLLQVGSCQLSNTHSQGSHPAWDRPAGVQERWAPVAGRQCQNFPGFSRWLSRTSHVPTDYLFEIIVGTELK